MKNLRLAVGVTMMALSSALLVPSTVTAQAVVPTPVHGTVVPETPERNWPQILNGSIEGGDQVGDVIVYGGSFTQIALPDGSVINQPYAVAFDVNTGALIPGFRPALNKPVSVVEAGDTPGTVFLGGKFSSVDGAAFKRLAKLNVSTGQLVTSFKSNPTGEVKTIARDGDRLFIGGTFGKVRGQVRSNLAEVSATDGRPSADFTIGVTGSRASGTRADGYYKANLRGAKVRAVRVTPDGNSLMLMHRGDLVGGQTRWGAAKIDISSATPSVTGWRTDLWDLARNNGRRDFVGIVEGDISPDGSFIAMTTIIGNFPPLHDTTIALPTGGDSLVQPLWVTQNFDSNYGLAISDAAVYVGGHFCWTESMQSIASPMYWPGNSGNRYSCKSTSGSVFQPQTTYRYHLAALDTATGRALDWNPQSNNSNNGVNFLRTIPRGLLLGHDGTRVNNFNVGRSAFFDLQ